ncbi:MAG: hypothetical protein D6808_02310 [Candidatus Dadabacteria bacterium]|nr:MAG: hypothetical protein D6808_02310 [Candidatus Dadabacteria bacterium]
MPVFCPEYLMMSELPENIDEVKHSEKQTYPHCVLPPNFFDLMLKKKARSERKTVLYEVELDKGAIRKLREVNVDS